MPDHLIRLRGPWELLREGRSDADPPRIELPARSLTPTDRPLILQCRFGRPARPEIGSSCRLLASDVPGLLRVSLNGLPILEIPPRDQPSTCPIDLPIGRFLRARNLLQLTVDPAPFSSENSGRPWGSICLRFATDDLPDG